LLMAGAAVQWSVHKACLGCSAWLTSANPRLGVLSGPVPDQTTTPVHHHRECTAPLCIGRDRPAIMASKVNSEAGPWNRETKDKFEGRVCAVPPRFGLSALLTFGGNSKDRSEYLDPCQEAAARSIRCLHRNGGDRTLCSDYFESVIAWGCPTAMVPTQHFYADD
jgi:cytochrome c oxidase assembly protein subunit 23